MWQKLYYLHQKEYQRQRLWAIKYLYEDQSREDVTKLVNCSYKTLSNWIDKFIEGGLSELLKPIKPGLLWSRLGKCQSQAKRIGYWQRSAELLLTRKFLLPKRSLEVSSKKLQIYERCNSDRL